jgi:nucleoside-diphosphate-sugar epimerase
MALYLVTGGAGFIGSHITAGLVARGDRVRVLDDLSTGTEDNLTAAADGGGWGAPGSGATVEFMPGDVADPRCCAAACEGVDGVFHEAAQVSVPESLHHPLRSYEVNVMGTLHLLEAARAAGVERVVFAASSAAYGNSEALPKVETMVPTPLSPYASGKVAGEHLLRVWGLCHGIRTVCLRYFNIFGPRQADDSPYTGVIALFARALIEGRPPMIHGDGEQTRDFTFVDNAVAANLSAMAADLEPGTIINVGSGERISINNLFGAMAEILGSDLTPEHGEARAGDVRHSVADLSRARDLLGYEPRVGWREGLGKTLEWYQGRSGPGEGT